MRSNIEFYRNMNKKFLNVKLNRGILRGDFILLTAFLWGFYLQGILFMVDFFLDPSYVTFGVI